MAVSKEQLVKDIINLRRRVNVKKGADIREIEVFEDHYDKSFRRVEQERYLAKKFTQDELVQTYKAYETLI